MKPAIFLTVLRGIETFAQGLLEQGDVELVSMYDATYPLLDRSQIPYRKFSDFYTEEHKRWAANEAGARAKVIAAGLQSPEMRRNWPRFECDDRTWDRVAQEVTLLFRRDFFEQMTYVDAFRRCASALDLRLVIVQQDIARDTKTIIYTAHRLGIPALHVLHGFPSGATNTRGECFADVVAAYSERSKRVFESFGMPPDRVHVTGNPEWDQHARPPAPDYRETACRMMGVDPARPVILYAITYTHRFSRISVMGSDYVKPTTAVVLESFAELSRRHPEWQFVLRPHPHDLEGAKTLRDDARAAGLDRVWIDDQKTPPLFALSLADVMVCTQSNLGIEAILAGKPVVNVVIDAFGHDVFYEGLGPLFLEEDAVLHARTAEEVLPAVESAVTDPDVRQRLLDARPGTIERFHYKLDGKATERFSALAISIVEHSNDYVQPVGRFPEFEFWLAQAVPTDARRALVMGRAASHVADAIRFLNPELEVEEAAAMGEGSGDSYEVVALSDPLPHDASAGDWLRAARARLRLGGVVVAAFRHGGNVHAGDAVARGAWAPPAPGMEAASPVGEYSRIGFEVALSRCDLEPVEIVVVRNAASDEGRRTRDQSWERSAVDGWVVCAMVRDS